MPTLPLSTIARAALAACAGQDDPAVVAGSYTHIRAPET